MKDFEDVAFDPAKCRRDLAAFGKLLEKESLSERKDLSPMFQARRQLAVMLGTFAPDIGPAARLAYEFPFLGDFTADIVLGNKEKTEYCVVELEDGRPNSIFAKAGKKSTKEWSRRFEHGFSQLVDWFYSLDDIKKTARFTRDFGPGHINFVGLLIIGRRSGLTDHDRDRLKWRTDKVLIDSHSIICVTFDDLHEVLSKRLGRYTTASRLEGRR